MKPRSAASGNYNGKLPILLGLNALLLAALLFRSNSSSTTVVNTDLLVGQQQQQKEDIQRSLEAKIRELEFKIQEKPAEAEKPKLLMPKPRSFLEIGKKTGTDKVEGHANLEPCLNKGRPCVGPKLQRDTCKPWGHFYDTLYQRWLGPLAAEKFQFLEIGFYSGSGFEAFEQFLPHAEAHSIEISCVNDGKDFQLGNTAKSQRPQLYQKLLNERRLHCGSAVDINFLNQIWTTYMHRSDAPPLKVVVDDASHRAIDMIQSVFFWFPKIEPGGFMIVEDIQPIQIANQFRTQFLPQLMSDLHWCGPADNPEEPFFDTLWPLLASISCEMHICIFERNEQPANFNLPDDQLKPPMHALDYEMALKTKKTDKSLK